MIRVELVGGAKKSFATGAVEIDRDSAAVCEILGILNSMRLEGSPEIDSKNTLVAINGADTSATGGESSVARGGDTISIIPIIHGGAPSCTRMRIDVGRRHFDLVGVRLGPSEGAGFLDAVRADHPRLRIQAVSSRYVLSAAHAKRIVVLSAESERRGTLLANKIETDLLMRFALTRQIKAAISSAGIGPSARGTFILVSTGPAKSLDALHARLETRAAEMFSRDNAPFLRRAFGISKRSTGAAASETPLEDVLAERAAVLGADAA